MEVPDPRVPQVSAMASGEGKPRFHIPLGTIHLGEPGLRGPQWHSPSVLLELLYYLPYRLACPNR